MDRAQITELVRKYLGQNFGEGFASCRMFSIDFYKMIFEIEIPTDYMEMLRVMKVVKAPKFGDVVLIQNHPIVVNHIGIYLGENEFLHSLGRKDGNSEVILSRITDSPWKDRIAGYLRHPKNYASEI
jgi:cell wall-associated NlpC family hydrolase